MTLPRTHAFIERGKARVAVHQSHNSTRTALKQGAMTVDKETGDGISFYWQANDRNKEFVFVF